MAESRAMTDVNTGVVRPSMDELIAGRDQPVFVNRTVIAAPFADDAAHSAIPLAVLPLHRFERERESALRFIVGWFVATIDQRLLESHGAGDAIH